MKKSIFTLLIAMMAVFANAQQDADGLIPLAQASCNFGPGSTLNVQGIPDTSCSIMVTNIGPGFEVPLPNDGSVQFFFDSGYKVNLSGNQKKMIRFNVFENEKEYKGIQALVQTAYATRAPLYVIFVNPLYTNYPFANIGSKRSSSQACYDTGLYYYCPVQAIQLGSN